MGSGMVIHRSAQQATTQGGRAGKGFRMAAADSGNSGGTEGANEK